MYSQMACFSRRVGATRRIVGPGPEVSTCSVPVLVEDAVVAGFTTDLGLGELMDTPVEAVLLNEPFACVQLGDLAVFEHQ